MFSTEKLRWPVTALVFLFPIVAASVKDGGTSIFILLLLLGLVFGWPAWKELSVWEKRVLIGFMVFFGVLMLTMINTDDYATAIKKLERFVRLLAIVPVYMLMRRVKLEASTVMYYGAIVGCFVLGVQAWYSINVLNNFEVHGVYHKIIFGDAAVLLSALVVAGLFFLNNKWWQYAVAGSAVVFGLYATLMSMTRGAWLLVPILVVMWLWLFRKKITAKGWVGIGGVVTIVALIGFLWAPPQLINGVQRGINDLKTYQENPGQGSPWGSRINMWRDSVTLFSKQPLLGTGIGDYALERQQLMDSGEAFKDYPYGHAHSIYFHALATTGAIGFTALIVCLFILPFLAFYRAWYAGVTNAEKYNALAGLTVLFAFAEFGISEGWLVRNPFMNQYLIFTAVFLSGIAATLAKLDGKTEQPANDKISSTTVTL